MILLLLGLAFVVAGVIVLGTQFSSLATLKSASGVLIGYEKDAVSQEFHPVVSFNYNTDKYFFKNSGSLPSPRFAIGSEQKVYYLTPKPPVALGAPLKAMLSFSGKHEALPWILIAIGFASFGLFCQLAGLYLTFVVSVVAFKYFYGWARTSLEFADLFNFFVQDNPERFPLSETFPETAVASLALLDKNSLQHNRDQWLAKQTGKGWIFSLFALGCFGACYLSVGPDVAPRVKVHVKRQPLTAEQVVDAGSAQAAEAKFGGGDEGNPFCLWFESDSCFYTYEALDAIDTSALMTRVLTTFLADAGVILMMFALVGFYSKKIFIREDPPILQPTKGPTS